MLHVRHASQSPKLRMLTVSCTIPFASAPSWLKSSFLKLSSSSKLLSHIIVTFKPFPPAAFRDLYKLWPSERRVFLRYIEVNGWLVAHVRSGVISSEPQTEPVKDFLFIFDLECLLPAALVQRDKQASLSFCLCVEQQNHDPDSSDLV